MPAIGIYHPQIVHFVIALLIAGVVFRLVSLTGRFRFTSGAAATLLIVGTLASVAAVKSGTDAHGPVERVPGARAAVIEHEEWGERTRNIFLVVALLEIVALALAARSSLRYARPVAIASAVVGVIGLAVLYEAGEHGGELVYSYAGGVGIKSGNPEDVHRLFVAGVYQQALQDRHTGRGDQGAALIDMAAARFPQHTELQLLAIEWTTEVRKDPGAALQRLDALPVSSTDTRLRVRAGIARASALQAQGNVEGARGVLRTLLNEFPNNANVQRRLDALK